MQALARDLYKKFCYKSDPSEYFNLDAALDLLTEQERKDYEYLKRHEALDLLWYMHFNQDVFLSGLDATYHYIRYGARERRRPNSWFVLQRSNDELGDRDLENEFAKHIREHSLSELSNQLLQESDHEGRRHHYHYYPNVSKNRLEIAIERFRSFAFFEENTYLRLNEPLKAFPDLDLYEHALMYGIAEGRSIFDKHTVARMLGALCSPRGQSEPTSDCNDATSSWVEIGVLVNSKGNMFLRELADVIYNDLIQAGYKAVRQSETDDPSRSCKRLIIVAPHEFFFMEDGQKWATEDVLNKSIMWNTEQPQTVWFERAIPYSLMSRGLIDISPQLADLYARTGVKTTHIDPVGPRQDRIPDEDGAMYRVLPSTAKRRKQSELWKERPIDLSFFGAMTNHRDRFFARSSAFFSRFETYFYIRRAATPLTVETSSENLTILAGYVAERSKIALNVHRDEYAFFEWHRIVRTAMESGALVVSEPCMPHPTYKPNVHYFEESGRHLHNLIEWLLCSSDGQEAATAACARCTKILEARRAENASGHQIAGFVNTCFGDTL